MIIKMTAMLISLYFQECYCQQQRPQRCSWSLKKYGITVTLKHFFGLQDLMDYSIMEIDYSPDTLLCLC